VIEGLGLTERDRVVFVTPLSHSYGVDVLAGTLMAGACLRVCPQFDAELVARELEEGATVLPGVPFVFEALARRARTRETSLRVAVSAGSPLPERVRRAFSEAWGLEVGQLYGSTELGAVTMDEPGATGFDAGSVGRPVRGVSVRVVDVDDPRRMLGAGEEGQLVVRAGSMLSGYLDGEVPLTDGHFLTGDLARIASDGRVTITGRLKMLIDVGAYKVNPLEVEGVLGLHPGVAECVVTGVAASETVQRLRAVVVARDAASRPTSDELRRFVRERLSAIKVPRTVEFVSSLPKTATGKVMRDRV
jgi:long-chain acyl-CoA synthetase